MQTVKINSFCHYKIVEHEGRLVLLEFGDECPAMGHRQEYTDDEGEEVASWSPDEPVEFIYDLSEVDWMTDEEKLDDKIAIAVVPITSGIGPWCGDDFRYHILDHATE